MEYHRVRHRLRRGLGSLDWFLAAAFAIFAALATLGLLFFAALMVMSGRNAGPSGESPWEWD